MNEMDQCLDEMASLIRAANDDSMTVEELKKLLDAWHEKWIDSDKLTMAMKLGVMAAFAATFQAVAQGHSETQLHRDLDQIARDGGSRPGRST